MIYEFKAIDLENKIIQENITSISQEDAIKELTKNNLKVIWIKNKDIKNKKINLIKKEKMQFLLYKLYIMTSSNIILPKAIQILATEIDIKNKSYADIVLSDLDKGEKLSTSLKNIGIFPELVVNMISVGEQSSNLTDVFKNLSDYYKEEIKFEKDIKSALYYPILLLIVTFFIVNFLVVTVLPNFVEVFYNTDYKLPIMTKVLIKISVFLNKYIVYLNVGILLLIVLIYFMSKVNEIKYYIDKIKLKNKLYRSILLKRFSSILNLLLKSHITLYESLLIISKSTSNLVFKNDIEKICEDIKSGNNFSETIGKSKIFTPIFISMVNISEESSKAEEVFKTLEEYFDYETKTIQKKFITLLEPSVIIVLSVVVGFVILAIAIPMFDVVNRI